ncbi:MAG: VacJ family lipoprotein [Xanthomonadaceae bacterium]|jgi:phospholipid-binding lipoprotein MlaA|nr:VacJ family lipoprotein [Xanthomonadaceae bacterium]
MKAIRSILMLTALSALLAACASAPHNDASIHSRHVHPAPAEAEAAAETLVVDEVAATTVPADADISLAVASAAPVSGNAMETDIESMDPAEEDYAALYGAQGTSASAIYDPWERFNREMHGFNNAMDFILMKPLARGYIKITPRPVRTGVRNFFDNLRSPAVMLNQLLQGKPGMAGKTFVRFLVNSTLGVGGVLDPATDARLPRTDTDFGETLATWGWRSSRYLELPFFGPRTVRDSAGLAGDSAMSLTWLIDDDKVSIGTEALGLIDARAQALPLEDVRKGAIDDYSLIRDAWMQRRQYYLQQNARGHTGHSGATPVPEYLLQE